MFPELPRTAGRHPRTTDRWTAFRSAFRHHVRHASWRIVIGAALGGSTIFIAAVMLASHHGGPVARLSRLTGIRPCRTAVVREVETPYNDLVRFELSADSRVCDPALAVSIVAASGGACREILDRTGGCAYGSRKSVVVRRGPPQPDGSARYTIDAY